MREGRTVDILYVIGLGSVSQNAELRYSLRTVDRHCKGVGRVIISGDIPDFVSNSAVKVPCHDQSVCGKHWNMLYKIEQGIRKANLTEPFLISCDDHFFAKDVDLRKWPQRKRRDHIYTEASWGADNPGKPIGKYQRAVAATGQLLRENNLPDVDTVWHGDMWIDPKYLDDVISLSSRFCSRSIYGFEPMMLFEAFRRRDNPYRLAALERDVKAGSFEKAEMYAKSYGFFSTSDNAWKDGRLEKWFKNNYPEKSRWEI